MTALMLVTIGAQAQQLTEQQRKQINIVANYYGISSHKLIRIAYVESKFKQDAIRHNKNGTIDVGFFQINSIHFNTTCKYLNLYTFEGNLECAAVLVAFHKKYQDSDAMWAARFHSKTPSLKAKYYKKLQMVPEHILAGN